MVTSPMENLSVKVPKKTLRIVDDMVRSGMFISRSECFRTALFDLLNKRTWELKKLYENKSIKEVNK
jgi:Arc/MetJ-type ribon-helix-helix transcriptional regulator